jgi:hypothetical protein
MVYQRSWGLADLRSRYYAARGTTKDENPQQVEDSRTCSGEFRNRRHAPAEHHQGRKWCNRHSERNGVESRNLTHTGTGFLDSLRSLEMTWERSFIFEAEPSVLTPQVLSDIIIGTNKLLGTGKHRKEFCTKTLQRMGKGTNGYPRNSVKSNHRADSGHLSRANKLD